MSNALIKAQMKWMFDSLGEAEMERLEKAIAENSLTAKDAEIIRKSVDAFWSNKKAAIIKIAKEGKPRPKAGTVLGDALKVLIPK